MQNLKEQLVQWVEAYAAAKLSGNPSLVQFAAGNLSAFIESIELSKVDSSTAEEEVPVDAAEAA